MERRFTPKPPWLKVRAPGGDVYHRLKQTFRELDLHTVCEEARCPNVGECWREGTATVMLLGDVCTRGCRFCAVTTGDPRGAVDTREPEHVSRAIARLELTYVVLTMVDRDDLLDGGAEHVARTVTGLRALRPDLLVETLVGDFHGHLDPVATVVDAQPDVFAHNVEVVRRLQRSVRDVRCSYDQSMRVLRWAKERMVAQQAGNEARPSSGGSAPRQPPPGVPPHLASLGEARPSSGGSAPRHPPPGVPPHLASLGEARRVTKSSIMVGIGETDDEVIETMGDLRAAGVDVVTIGQYLRPTPKHHEVARFVPPDVFADYQRRAHEMGFLYAASGPLVRSSYKAAEVFLRGVLGHEAAAASLDERLETARREAARVDGLFPSRTAGAELAGPPLLPASSLVRAGVEAATADFGWDVDGPLLSRSTRHRDPA